MPHVSLERLEVQGFAAGLADDLADGKVLIQLGLDGLGVLFAVPGGSHFIGHIGIGTKQRHHALVESYALRFMGFQVVGNLGIAAEVVNVLQLTLGRLYWLAQQEQGFQRSIQPFPAQCQPVLQHHLGVSAACTVVDLRGVHRNGFFHLLEQVLVIDDVAKVLVIAVQSVGAADCLEQTMVLHGLVDVQVRAGRCIKAGQQLVHHDQQAHVGRLLDEQSLGLVFVGFRLGLAWLGLHIAQQLGIGVVGELLVGLCAGANLFQRHILGLRVVRGDDRAPALEQRLLKQREVFAGLVDARRHQDGIAAFTGQARFDAEVKNNVRHHPVHAGFGAEHVLHRAPLLFQLFFLPVVQRLGLGVKPLVDLVLRSQLLVNVAGLVHQVQHHAIFHGFAEFVGVDVAAKYFQAGGFVFLEQGRAGEADEHRIGHQRLHHAVELAALCAVAFVHKYKHLTHRGAGLRLQVFDKCVKVRIGIFGRRAKLVHQRA